MKLAVIGAAGLLGQKLVEAAIREQHKVIPFDKLSGLETDAGPVQPLDITDLEQVSRAIEIQKPDWIINAAAYTAVDASEEDLETVKKVNIGGVKHLLEAAASCKARLLTMSTDYVFDGSNGPYSEEAPRQPLGVYGASKAKMEDIVLEDGGPHLIVRTMVLYGAALKIKTNFALWVLNGLLDGKEFPVVTDQVGNTTLTSDLARILIVMMEQECEGIYHVAGAERISRYEFAQALAQTFRLNSELIKPILTEELDQKAIRPLESGFILDRLYGDLELQPLSLDLCLKRFSDEVERYGY